MDIYFDTIILLNICGLIDWNLRKTMLGILKGKPHDEHEEIVRALIASVGQKARQKREAALCA
jgi:hypothetical protein